MTRTRSAGTLGGADAATHDAAPASMGPVAKTAAAVAARLASHVPLALRSI